MSAAAEITYKVEMDGYGGFVIRKPAGGLLREYYYAGYGLGGMLVRTFDDMDAAAAHATKLAQTDARVLAEKGVVVFEAVVKTRPVCGCARGPV